ncbi:hypothetical protein AVEN_102980-1 [Araneus ventricosus]|uniref:Reverse transcriptase/retrotransposon-derived protein RNase H-like domain-containing protein n=1 Tax=Araneus ventricosus TaxID=182803 RepID=A0A4Y2B7J9_ARAVE|nr:hypothetical protein AVEN_102980-1 [Araneus ventricosus]
MFSVVTAPLTNLLKGWNKKGKIEWNEECTRAVELLKDKLTSKPKLHAPGFTEPFILQTDASDLGLTLLDPKTCAIAWGVWSMRSLLPVSFKGPDAYRHSVLEQSTIVTLEGSDWTNESDVTLLHIASTVRHAYLIYST